MAINLNDLIHIHEDVLDSQICDFLINTFENHADKHERIENKKRPNFTQFNLTKNVSMSEKLSNIHNYLIQTTLRYQKKYYEFVDKRCFPEENSFEQFRIKRYNNDGNDLFDTHVDVTDYYSSKRFLSFMWYLNDVDEGGETIFDSLTIKPKTGTMIIFPPLWMYPHKGAIPISNPKYVMSTYLHYE